jgi:hypothetical protein
MALAGDVVADTVVVAGPLGRPGSPVGFAAVRLDAAGFAALGPAADWATELRGALAVAVAGRPGDVGVDAEWVVAALPLDGLVVVDAPSAGASGLLGDG